MTIKNAVLSGTELMLTGFNGCNAAIRNDSAGTLLASRKPGISVGEDDVLSIPAGGSAVLYGISGTVYLSGSGEALIITSDYPTNPFKPSQSGGSGADEVARTAIGAHEGNTAIHVTAGDKQLWSGKAELSDIPDKLPADGGNSDTVDGLHDLNIFRYTELTAANSTIASITATGIYKSKNWTDHPSGCLDGQGILIVLNYSAGNHVNPSGTIGTTSLWIRQLFISPHDNSFWCRFISNKNVNEWERLSDGGNAASLEGHTASEFALRSDLDALAQRVTALE